MSFSNPMIKLKEVLIPIDREEVPQSGVVYRQIGVKWWGKGAYEREAVDGGDTKYKKFNQIKKDDVVINKIWARHGSVCVIPEELDGCFVSTEFPIFLINKDKLSPYWFHIITQMKFFWSECDKLSSGTSGKNRIKPEKFLEIEIPLPKIEEQEKLIGLINKYKDRLNVISTHREKALNDYHHLKNSILQAAVQGKLVPHDPNDEPASVLLEKIKAEKEQLLRDRKIKKEKPFPDITKDDIPFELPLGWEWVRLEELGITVTGKTPPTNVKEYYNGEIPFLNPGNINKGKMNYSGKTLTIEGSKFSQLIPKDSILMVCINGSLQNGIGQVAINNREITVNQQINALIPCNSINSKYILNTCLSYLIQSQVKEKSTGTVNYIINKSSFGKLLFPLPPHNEQKRIVEKVDQMMTLCDELEKTMEQSKKNSEMLMQSILQGAFKMD